MKKLILLLAFVFLISLTSAADLIINSGTTVVGGDQDYDRVFVASGATLQVNSSDGYLNITATNITIAGTVTGDLQGFAGGNSVNSGTCGTSGTANGNAGSGDGGGSRGECESDGSLITRSAGGGGGGHGTTGGAGASNNDAAGGAGGVANGDSTDRNSISIGSGGASGTRVVRTGGVPVSGAGGNGSASIKFSAPLINITGTINMRGSDGTLGVHGGADTAASGGAGGSGGTIILEAGSLLIDTATMDVSGGDAGGSACSADSSAAGSGGGSGGFVKLFYQSIVNSSTTITLSGGAGGNGVACNQAGGSNGNAGGSGVAFHSEDTPVITLIEPADASNKVDATLSFNSSLDPLYPFLNVSNATLFVYNSTGGVFFSDTNTVTGDAINYSTWDVPGFTSGSYEWNVFGCFTDGIDDTCVFAPTNSSFSWGFLVNTRSHELITTEGQSNSFELNISIGQAGDLDEVRLWYDGTARATSITQLTSTNYTLSSTVVAPAVSANTNYTFHWEIILKGQSINDTTFEQQVNNLGIDNCGSFSTLILNYTLKDEENLLETNITNPVIELDVDIFTLGGTTPIIEFSQNYTNVTTAQVCLENALGDSTYEMDVVARYESDLRESEFNNIQNLTLSTANIPQNIDLLDLLTEDSQEFLITFKDDSFTPVSEALITITRKYVAEGLFRTVESPLTNADGQAIAHLVIADVIYTIQVTKNGVLLATFDNIVAFCSDITIGQCEINLDAFSTGVNPTDFNTVNDLAFIMSFDKPSRTITTVFTVPSGGVSTISLNATLFDNRGNTSVCSDSLTSSSGTLTCVVPASYGNVSILATLSKDGTLINSALYTIKQDVNELFGGTGYIFLLLLYLTLPLMFITTGPGMVIAAILGLVFGALLNIFNTNNIIGIGSTILWFVIAGGIIAWKVSKRE